MNNGIDTQPQAAHEIEAKPSFEKGHIEHEDHTDLKSNVADYKVDAIEAENSEHSMTVMEAARAYPMACFWAFVMSFTIIMESYDVFLMNNFIALPAFANRFGVLNPATGTNVIVTKWQSALQMSGQLGALIGVFIAGPLTSRIGYRWATLLGLALMNATIFVTFFADSLPVFFVGQLLEGLPWGYLHRQRSGILQMFWAVGSIIVGAVTFVYNTRLDESAYKIPIALQWLFPTPLMILMFLAPESPWWLVRKGRHEQAARSIERLGRKSRLNAGETVAMMRRVVELEKSITAPNYLELFRGSDLRRTLIVCGIYAAQNLAGNLIANQAVYFFEQAGMTTNLAFALGLITSALQMIFVMLSWILTTYFGRRPIYLWGTAFNVVMLVALGIAASVGASKSANFAQASFGLIASVMFTFTAAPVSWCIIAETSAIRLRPLTTGIGRASYYIIEIPCIFLGSFMLNPTGGNLGGKCGYVWGGTALATLITAYFCLPEMKGRSYREIDIMFRRRIPARQFEKTVIGPEEDE
ncbi:MFS transporter, SP family, general alpha glucoside:H+ symporter [Mycena venus]|uniref:MFS transporter, SP family, general alpha glucoside:H+ symporter n=1 Tax=Mycena venus TaxID=2733690 RepID=A0A8H6YA94_9AGAR|nr:MFS transporter, SP family, general alpha glucoside:H+ symporter [Mycena venus]